MWHVIKGDLDAESINFIKEATGHKADNVVDLTEFAVAAGSAKAVSKTTNKAFSEASSKLKDALSKARKVGTAVNDEARAVARAARQAARKQLAKFKRPRRTATRVDLERLLKEHGIPSTLSEEQRAACDAAGLEMKLTPNNTEKVTVSNSKILIDAEKFEKSLVALSPSERVAKILDQARQIAEEKGWQKTNLAARNGGREIYFDKNLKQYYAIDTQHGRFELLNKRGKHLGELKIDLSPVENSIDLSGGHDIFT